MSSHHKPQSHHHHYDDHRHNPLLNGTFLFGTGSNDTLNGTSWTRFIFGLGGDDLINGGRGSELIVAGDGNDTVHAGRGNDTVFGGADNDLVSGDAGNDLVSGDSGNDTVLGGTGNDVVLGGAGNDLLLGGPGNDLLIGGEGSDKFMIKVGSGVERIADLQVNDHIDLRAFGFASAQDVLSGFVQHGHDAVLNLGNGDRLVLQHTRVADLDAEQFIVSDTETGPSSSESPYLVPLNDDVSFVSVLTAGDQVGGYTMAGTPDGLGAFDNGDGTFTVLMNHEFGTSAGAVRDHGATGSFISEWVIDKGTLQVVSGHDLIQTVHLYDAATDSYYDPETDAGHPVSGGFAFNRLCSADLAPVSAFYNANTGLGYNGHIFLNGEENGPPFGDYGRAFAHFVGGVEDGNSYELPGLGALAHENVVASAYTGNRTVVATMEDGGNNHVYFYAGDKQSTGTALDMAGLTNGHLFGLQVTELVDENPAVANPLGADNVSTFNLVDLGDADQLADLGGAGLDAAAETAGVTSFFRPEDGAWDTVDHNRFYFVTTASFNDPSRLWAVDFQDAAHPENGGTISLLLDGTEGQHMFDNITVSQDGKVLIQEDPGSNSYLSRVWEYDPKTDALTPLAEHDPARFAPGGADFLTTNEESSGIIDVTDILGTPGQSAYLLDVQAHFSNPTPGVVEGGQLMVMYQDHV